MDKFKEYRKKNTQFLRPYEEGENVTGISISIPDKENGSPLPGDMIAVSKDDNTDKWLVSKEFFDKNYELAN